MNQNEQDFAPPAFDQTDAPDIVDSVDTPALSPDEILAANAGPAGQGAEPLAGHDRTPPRNIEIEQALLSALLTNNKAFDKVSDFLRPDHFAEPVHGRIYDAINKMIDLGKTADALTLRDYFDDDGALEEVGGGQYLVELQNALVSIINAGDYGRTIYDMFLRRQLIGLGEDIVNDAFVMDLEDPADFQIRRAEEQLYSLGDSGHIENGPRGFADVMSTTVQMIAAATNRDTAYTGVASGFRDLDKRLGGLNRSDLIILAARPAMGKTALATNIAFNAAKGEEAVVAFFSMEMSSEQLATRMLAEQTGISSEKLRKGEISTRSDSHNESEFARLVTTARDLEKLRFYVDDTPALPVGSLRTRARRLKRQNQGKLDLIIVDYLQLMQGKAGTDNRVQEISEISRGLKAIAKEMDCPVIALSQLSRQVENREDKRPQLADLRESGSIEQDADQVLFIFRQAYYEQNRMPQKNVGEDESAYQIRVAEWQAKMDEIMNISDVIIAKNRHGPTATVKLFFDGATTRFTDYQGDQGYDD